MYWFTHLAMEISSIFISLNWTIQYDLLRCSALFHWFILLRLIKYVGFFLRSLFQVKCILIASNTSQSHTDSSLKISLFCNITPKCVDYFGKNLIKGTDDYGNSKDEEKKKMFAILNVPPQWSGSIRRSDEYIFNII